MPLLPPVIWSQWRRLAGALTRAILPASLPAIVYVVVCVCVLLFNEPRLACILLA